MNETKTTFLSSSTSIKKSNIISKAKLFHGLSLNQMQLFSYAIYVTQQNGESSFNKADFERQFNMTQYHTQQAYKDSKALIGLSVELPSDDSESFQFRSVFEGIDYKSGVFTFGWTKDIKPHIEELKNRYIQTDLKIAVKFKSSFSWTLYEYLKASYGNLYLTFSKEELMNIFSVENVRSYKENTSLFKANVLNIAIEEVNKYTEYQCTYEEIKKGRAIKGFKIYFNKGEIQQLATTSQIEYLTDLCKSAQYEFMFKINEINDQEQRKFASHLLEEIVSSLVKIEKNNQLIQAFVDENIKKTNEKINLIKKIIEDDKLIRGEISTEEDLYRHISIPMHYWNEEESGNN